MINALKYVEELEQTGFTSEQAKTSVTTWLELMNENLATKDDMKEFLFATKNEFKEFQSATKMEFQDLDHRMKSLSIEVGKIGEEMKNFTTKNDLKDLKKDLVIQLGIIVGGSITLLGSILGIIVFFRSFT